MNDELKQKFKHLFSLKGNVWVTVIITLAVLGIISLVSAASGHPLLSSAGGQTPRVRLIDETGSIYPDSINVIAGQTIQVGWQGHLVKPCQANGWTKATDKTIQPLQVGPFTQSVTTLSVTCGGTSGPAVSASLYVYFVGGGSGAGIVSPKKGDMWLLGKTYTIQWQNPTDTGAPAPESPAQPAQCKIYTVCPPGNPIDLQPLPIGPSITLNHPEPACMHGPGPRCLMPTHIPYQISCDQQSATSCTWTISTSLDPWFVGTEQITVAFGGASPRNLTSDEFTIASDNQPASDLRVISPNGGEIWQRGTTQEIRWSGPSALKLVNIDLVEYVNCNPPRACMARLTHQYPLANQTPNDGSFNWTVGRAKGPVDVPSGQYFVSISDASGKYSDESDSSFTVADKSGGTTTDSDTFTLQRGQSHNLAGHSGLVVTFSDFVPVACTQKFAPDPNCIGVVVITVGDQKFEFQTPAESQTIAPGVQLTLVSMVKGGLVATFTAQ